MRLRLRVKEVAKARSVSMTRLHITSEVAYSTIRRVFRDPYVEVTTTTINRLARALDVAPTSLLEDAPDDESGEKPS
jgi:DNA-binding Xre family transcriptional regulator